MVDTILIGVIFFVLGVLIGLLLLWMFKTKKLERDYKESQDIINNKNLELVEFKRDIANLKEKLSEQQTTDNKLNEMLNNAITKTFTEKNDSLLSGNKKALDEVVNPMTKEFEKLRKDTMEVKASLEAQINNQIKQVKEMNLNSEELVKALTSQSKFIGNYGELVLENALIAANLREGIDYQLQAHHINEDGRKIFPDAIVNIPDNRKVIIDSKLSFESYMNYKKIEDDNVKARDTALKGFIKSVRDRVDELSIKEYDQIVKDSLDFVFMFIANESLYNEAIINDPDLLDFAYKRRIIIISPTTMYFVLVLIKSSILGANAYKNLENVRNNAGRLFDKVSLFFEEVDDVGRYLNNANNTFNNLQKRLSDEGKGSIKYLTQAIKNDGGGDSKKPPLIDNKKIKNETDDEN